MPRNIIYLTLQLTTYHLVLQGSLKGTVPTFPSEWKSSHFLFNLRRALSHRAIHCAISSP